MSIETVIQFAGWTSLALVALRSAGSLLTAAMREVALRRRRRKTLQAFKAHRATEPNERRGSDMAWQGKRKFRIVRRAFETPDRTVCSFYLAALDRKPLPSYRPGQFLTIEVPGGSSDDALRRCYSLSEAPDADGQQSTYRITVKRIEPPKSAPIGTPAGAASNYLHALQDNAIVDVHAPAGSFILEQTSTRPVVLIAGGVGITPIVSMLDWVVEAQPERQVWLFVGMRNRAGDIMHDHLRHLRQSHRNLRMTVFYSQPSRSCRHGIDYDVKGHVTVGHLSTLLEGSGFQFYVCGPDAMMKAIRADLAYWGVPERDVAYEAFAPAARGASGQPQNASNVGAGAAVYIDFARSNKRVRWTGGAGSLLELAEQNGINARYGCRAGGCGSCETPLIRGEIAYDRQPAVKPKAGTCLTCIARPTSDVVLEI